MDSNKFFEPITRILPPISHSLPTTPAPKGIPLPQLYPIFMDYRFPVLFATTYAVFISILNPNSNHVSRAVAKQKGLKTTVVKKSGKLMTAFVFLHNLALSIFSIATFTMVAPAFINSFWTHRDSFLDAYCDRDSSFWDHTLGYWGYLFYLSKYYEVIDTIIILLKSRRSSLLQTYHHSGAMITMWSGINFKAPPIWIFVVFNSFIHSIMYAYYALTAIGVNPPGKKYLTSLQIIQFIVGTSIAISYLFVPDCLASDGQTLATYINVAYLLPLLYLFVDFAKKMYTGVGNKKVN